MSDIQQPTDTDRDLQAICEVLNVVSLITDQQLGARVAIALGSEVLKPLTASIRDLRGRFASRRLDGDDLGLSAGEFADLACVWAVVDAHHAVWRDQPDTWDMFTRQDWLYFQIQVHRLAGRYADRISVEN